MADQFEIPIEIPNKHSSGEDKQLSAQTSARLLEDTQSPPSRSEPDFVEKVLMDSMLVKDSSKPLMNTMMITSMRLLEEHLKEAFTGKREIRPRVQGLDNKNNFYHMKEHNSHLPKALQWKP